jgi:glucosamine-6-phosphate deaminase
LVLGLPTGRTPVPLYRALGERHRAGRIDFSRVTTFNVDEFVGCAAGDRGSYRAFMQRHLFDHVNVQEARVHFLDGRAPDLDAECERYERALERAGGLDLLIAGLGVNAHIGFNEPAPQLVARTHVARLAPATRRANAGWFGGRLGAVPAAGLTMGVATLCEARTIFVLATGPEKAEAVAKMLSGRVSCRAPASLLQLHQDCQAWVDHAAAALLGRGRSGRSGRAGGAVGGRRAG